MTKKRTRFETFSIRFLVFTFAVFLIGLIFVKSIDSSYNNRIQSLQKEISTCQSDIDSLQMQKQELVSFNRLADVAGAKGYTYQNDAVASTNGENR